MAKLLIVDDEPNLLYSLRKALESDTLEVITAETGEEGLTQVREQSPDAVILDVRLPDRSGLDVFEEMRAINPHLPVIIATAFSTMDTAVESMKRGAYDYLLKPVELDQLMSLVNRALEVATAVDEETSFDPAIQTNPQDPIVGQSLQMQEVYKAIGRVAPQDITVLILGESGAGKELVARAIYQHSRRKNAPFLAINCAAIPETLLESELFGHERGAFTGAERERIGKFEQVDGGTLFLDEIGDMTGATQAKVLRLLQDGTFERVGGNQTRRANVRVIAATNRNLEDMVAHGSFRGDLYFRLKDFTIELPPLRDRMQDLPALVEHFVRLNNRTFGKSVRAVSPEAMRCLEQHSWPGNIRELQSAIKYAFLHVVGDCITSGNLPPLLRHDEDRETTPGVTRPPSFLQVAEDLLHRGSDNIYRHIHSDVDRLLLPLVLNHFDGNQVQAAQALGISRSTLRSRISELELSFETRVMPRTVQEEQT